MVYSVRMPMTPEAELTDAARKVHQWTERRNHLIRQQHAAGTSLRVLAARAMLSHTAIAKIVHR